MNENVAYLGSHLGPRRVLGGIIKFLPGIIGFGFDKSLILLVNRDCLSQRLLIPNQHAPHSMLIPRGGVVERVWSHESLPLQIQQSLFEIDQRR